MYNVRIQFNFSGCVDKQKVRLSLTTSSVLLWCGALIRFYNLCFIFNKIFNKETHFWNLSVSVIFTVQLLTIDVFY